MVPARIREKDVALDSRVRESVLHVREERLDEVMGLLFHATLGLIREGEAILRSKSARMKDKEQPSNPAVEAYGLPCSS